MRRRIGLLGQHAALDEELSGRQNLEMFGRLHHLGARQAGARADELLERFGLADTGRKAVKPVQRRHAPPARPGRLADHRRRRPEVLFLDEPTTGLDPRGRTEVWDAVRSLVGGGTTVLLTTQYLEEADQLADRISVIDHGRVVAEGTPRRAEGAARRRPYRRRPTRRGRTARRRLGRGKAASQAGDTGHRHPGPGPAAGERPVTDRMAALSETVRALEEAGIEAEDIALRRPTLDEVFLLPHRRAAARRGERREDARGGGRMSTYLVTDSWTMTRRELAHWAAAAGAGSGRPGLPGDAAADVRLPHRRRHGRGGDYLEFLVPGMLALTMAFGLEATMLARHPGPRQGRHRPVPLDADGHLGGAGRPERRRHAPVGARPAGPARRRARDRLALARRRRRRSWPPWDCSCCFASRMLWIGIHLAHGRGQAGAGAGRADPGLAGRLPLQRLRLARLHAGLAGRGRRVEPDVGHGTGRTGPVRQPRWGGGGSWATEHALLLAVVWPVVLSAVFFVLSVRRYRALGR